MSEALEFDDEELARLALDYAARCQRAGNVAAETLLRVMAGRLFALAELLTSGDPAPVERPTACAWCGSPLTTNRRGRPRRYCSKPCGYRWHEHADRPGKVRGKSAGAMVDAA